MFQLFYCLFHLYCIVYFICIVFLNNKLIFFNKSITREAKFRVQQQAELQALLKRIEGRRKEHIKQRSLDSKRLLQRNRNIQASLESQHTFDQQKLFENLKKQLNAITPTYNEEGPANIRTLKTADKEVSLIIDKKRKESVEASVQHYHDTHKESKESFLPQSVYGSNNRIVRQSNTATSGTADAKKKNGAKSSNNSALSNTLPSSLGNTGSSSIGSTTPTTPSKINPTLGGNNNSNTPVESTNSASRQQDPPFLHTNAPTLTSDGNVFTRA